MQLRCDRCQPKDNFLTRLRRLPLRPSARPWKLGSTSHPKLATIQILQKEVQQPALRLPVPNHQLLLQAVVLAQRTMQRINKRSSPAISLSYHQVSVTMPTYNFSCRLQTPTKEYDSQA